MIWRKKETMTADLDDDRQIRQRLSLEISRVGVRAMSNLTGIPTGTLEKYVAQTSVPSFVKAAQIARAAGVPLDQMAFGRPAEGRDIAIDAARLEHAIALIERGLDEAGRAASPSVKAGMVSAAYEILCEAREEVAEGRILRLVKG